MKGSGLNSWSKKQLTHSDHSEHLFKPLVFKKKKRKEKVPSLLCGNYC